MLINYTGFAQSPDESASDRYRIAFYNVENLFDTEDDSLTLDEEYLPGGMRGWNYTKLHQKFNHICKTIAALGEWNPPVIVGMAEVENRQVLEALILHTPLHRFQYQVAHHNSPDERGIDAALIYRADQFTVLTDQAWPVVFPFDPEDRTRDMLYVKGVLMGADTLHLVVNHWPSRRGGAAASEKYRLTASQILAGKIDSIFSGQPHANIILMGDFNDGPTDKSLTHLTESLPGRLVNISEDISPGTLKFEAEWATFDQFLVSAHLQQNAQKLSVKDQQAKVFNPSWLLEADPQYHGFKPKRTYAGYRYQGGFSDHLPVYIDLSPKNSFP